MGHSFMHRGSAKTVGDWHKALRERNPQDGKERCRRISESDHFVEEGGGGSPEVAGAVFVEDAELDDADVVIEEGDAVEGGIAADGVLVAAAVDHEGVAGGESLGVVEQQAGAGEDAESVLVAGHGDPGAAGGATSVEQAGLGGDDEDVAALLLVGQDFFGQGGALALAQVDGAETADDAVGDAATRSQHAENELDGLTVGGGEDLPARDGKPGFSAIHERLAGELLKAVSQAGKGLAQLSDLGFDGANAVGGGIDAIGAYLFVLELVADGVPLDDFDDAIGDFRLELLVHVEHDLRAVPVKAVDGRAVSVLRCLSEELLEQAILLFGGVAGEVQWNEQVVVRRQGCHSHRIPRASAQWTLRDVSASAGISAVRGGESCCFLVKHSCGKLRTEVSTWREDVAFPLTAVSMSDTAVE